MLEINEIGIFTLVLELQAWYSWLQKVRSAHGDVLLEERSLHLSFFNVPRRFFLFNQYKNQTKATLCCSTESTSQ